jgi:hypothetical protein
MAGQQRGRSSSSSSIALPGLRPQPPARAAAAAAAIACHIMYAMHAALMLCCRFMNEWRLDDSLNEMHDLFLKLRV